MVNLIVSVSGLLAVLGTVLCMARELRQMQASTQKASQALRQSQDRIAALTAEVLRRT